MPRKSMLRHVVYLFNYVGEVDEKATYQQAVIRNCYCPIEDSMRTSDSGLKTADNVKMYVFKRTSSVRSTSGSRLKYIPYDKWEKLASKTGYWTINPGKDYFVRSDRQERIRVKSFSDRESGSQRMWHFEVIGK